MTTIEYPSVQKRKKKQYSSHNPQKTKASICFRKHKKGISAAQSVMTPNRGNPFISGFFSPVLCISRHQNYGLDVARTGKQIHQHHFLNTVTGLLQRDKIAL